jgi:hypothetical protein
MSLKTLLEARQEYKPLPKDLSSLPLIINFLHQHLLPFGKPTLNSLVIVMGKTEEALVWQ